MDEHPADSMPMFLPSGPLPPEAAPQPRIGEFQLLRAMLEDARWCLLGRAGGSKEQREAEGWVTSRSMDPFTFEWTCEILSLDPAAVREKFAAEVRRGNGQHWTVRGQVNHRTYCERSVA